MVSQFYGYVKQFKWRVAKTMANIPHEYIVVDDYPDKQDVLKSMVDEINDYGYLGLFYGKHYRYLKSGEYKYWVVENIINRAKI